MRANKLLKRLRSVIGERNYDRFRETLGPAYRRARYDVLQPLQNWVQYRKRLSSVPQYDLERRDVLFLVVDCLRNDHLSRRGYERQTTPFIDTVGDYYPNCISAASWTYSSVPSILSGYYPHTHGAAYDTELRNQGMEMPPASVRDDVYILPELLAKSGYDTYLSTAIATAELPIRGRFETAQVHHRSKFNTPASVLVTELLDWWDGADGPRFGYVHFGDLHAHLRRPDVEPFGPIPDVPNIAGWEFTETTEPQAEFELYRDAKVKLYDSLLRDVDSTIQSLFEALERRDELDDTLVVIVGDHGEEFWERAQFERDFFHDPRGIYGTGHGHAMIPEVLEVPCILSGADLQETDEWISTTDIVPTVLTELGLSESEIDHLDGHPLQLPVPDRSVLAEEVAYGYDQQSVFKNDFQLFYSPYESVELLRDVERDELVDDPEMINRLKAHLPEETRTGSATDIDGQTRERLADLGYL
jgi:arylsulfatase A-like enzyme